MSSGPPIRVLLADDHTIVRNGMSAILSRQPDIEVAGLASNGFEAVDRYVALRPNLTLMDLSMPGMDGWDAISAIRDRDPRAQLLALSGFGGDEDIYRALAAGARGYLLKDASEIEILTAVRAVAAGARHIPARIAQTLSGRVSYEPLTSREIEILRCVARGLSNKEIAHLSSVTESTVKGHLNSILSKLGANDRTGAVTLALQRGLFRLDPPH
jgi:DNA-binding NarL/FixJ family response regulator